MQCIIPSEVKAPSGAISTLYPKLLKHYKDDQPLAYAMWGKASDAMDRGLIAPVYKENNGEPSLDAALAYVGDANFIQVNRHKIAAIGKANGKVAERLSKRLENFRELQGQTGFKPKEETTSELAKLLEELALKNEAQKFVDLLLYAEKDLRTIMEFLEDKFDPSNKKHADVLAQVAHQLETYQDIVRPDLAHKNTALSDSVISANTLYNEVKLLLQQKTEDYVVGIISSSANSEGLTEEQIRDYLSQGEDINLASTYLGDTSSSSQKLLAAADNIVKLKKQEIMDAHEQFREQVTSLGEDLYKAQGNKDFSWMLHLDKSGKSTGKYVKRVGESYNQARKLAEQDLFDEDGNRKQYFKGALTPDQRAFNIELAEAKDVSREFHKAEVADKDGTLRDGVHHKYTDEFKAARKAYQDYVMVPGEGKQWVRKAGYTDEQYDAFLRKYYKDEVTYTYAVKDPATKRYTGETDERRGRFPKAEYVEVKGHHDPKYAKLLADDSPKGKARLAFYEFFVSSYESDALKRLPKEVRQGMVGSLPVIRANQLSSLNTKGKGFLDAAGNALKNPLSTLKNSLIPEVFTKGRKTNEDGYLDHDLPIYYVGGFQNSEKIQKLEEELKALDPQLTTYKADKAKIERKLMLERNRMQGSEAETDLVESLLAFSQMAMQYQGLKSVESTLELVKAATHNRGYYLETKEGLPSLDKSGIPILKDKGSSNTEKRFAAWLAQNYYGDDAASQGKMDEAVRKVLAYTSVTLQALNPFSAVNNFVQANINQHVEAIGGTFYNREQYRKANAAFLSDVGNNVSEHVSHLFAEKKGYKDNPLKSKTDAMLKAFRVLQAGSEQQTNKTKSILDYGYIGIEAGEYQAQGTSAIAMMIGTPITGKDGTTSNVWDAHNLVKGKLVLNPNFEMSAEDKHKLTNKIKNVNRRIHGNYSSEDKVMLQQHWLGNLALQFKKWLFDGVRARWGEAYYDEGIGTQLEGRYRSVGRLFQQMKIFGFTATTYNAMSDLDKQNVRKTAAEAAYFAAALAVYFIVDAVAAGIPDDDDNMKAALNFLKKQASRTGGEVTTYVNPLQVYQQFKNPVAALSLVKDAGTFIQNVASVPFYAGIGQEEELYYKTGVHKGEPKLWKSTKDLIPALRVDRQIDQLFVSGDFFIR